MAKTLNTRIQLKKDTLSNWNTNNPVLLPGEVAIVETQGVGDSSAPISTRLKIGDGTTHFKDLKWVEAIASDVAAWAKQATKPSYTAEEVGAAPAEHTHPEYALKTELPDLSQVGGKAINAVVRHTFSEYTPVQPATTLKKFQADVPCASSKVDMNCQISPGEDTMEMGFLTYAEPMDGYVRCYFSEQPTSPYTIDSIELIPVTNVVSDNLKKSN